MLTEQELIDRLREATRRAGSQSAYARQYAISEQYLSDVLRGRREPGQKILDALGVERVVTYREKPVVTRVVTSGGDQPSLSADDPQPKAE